MNQINSLRAPPERKALKAKESKAALELIIRIKAS
jgi:hypothetical protein